MLRDFFVCVMSQAIRGGHGPHRFSIEDFLHYFSVSLDKRTSTGRMGLTPRLWLCSTTLTRAHAKKTGIGPVSFVADK
jgi:hypothetical protein